MLLRYSISRSGIYRRRRELFHHGLRRLCSSDTNSGALSDLVVVLDMDECLIHSQFLSSQGEYRQAEARPSSIEEDAVDSFKLVLPDGDLVHVHERPGLHDFLRKVSDRFEVHIFTAAMEIYASPLLDNLDPDDNIFSKRFYRDSCTLNQELGCYVKDLNAVDDGENGNEFKRMVLVDNNPLSFLAQPSNGILVSSFYDNPTDRTLPAALDLLHRLDDEDDVRPLLDEMFDLSAALAELQGKKRI